MASPADSVAFIGLGVMGYSMALNLRAKMDKHQTLYILDVSQDAITRFKRDTQDQGPVEVVTSGAEALKAADVVLSMLPDSPAVKKVYLDETSGVIAGARAAASSLHITARKLIVECGTIERETILEVAKATENAQQFSPEGLTIDFVDAPVSGGPMGAQAGSLAFMVGSSGPDEIFAKAKRILSHMGTPNSIFLCGGVGAGTDFKVINNYLSAITSLAASEALNIGVKLGHDPKRLTDVINASGGQCWVTSKSNPVPGVQANVPSSRDYERGFRIELCKKVLGMGTQLAEQAGARTVLDRPTMEAFEEAAADGRYKGKDARVVYKWLNESRR